MKEYNFGANILENLTTGMYQDSKVIYREYIQNACDQIDKAEKMGILNPRDLNNKLPDVGEGIIDICLKPERRYIAIEDNATGIKADDFQRTLGNIADSDKIMGKDKGFRGIGRLCGLAYCQKLVFTSRWIGENVVSVMTCDAFKMREMINDSNTKKHRYTALEVLNKMIHFDVRPATPEDSEHFFRVELFDINEENEELFGGKDDDNMVQLIDYLSFIAPVPYNANFIYRKEIYEHAKNLNLHIDEYVIKINGTQIFKKYKTHLKTGNGADEVFGVEFNDFYAEDGTILGWMWFGKTTFKAAIKEDEISRGLRLRKENIQIGEEDTLRGMFTREASKRGNNYFIGEVFAISKELIPNSQRTYFNENPIRINFEHKLKDYFNNTLYYIYYEGSDINSSLKKINTYKEKALAFKKKQESGTFLTNDEFTKEQEELKIKRQEAEKAKKNLDKKKENGRSILTREIVQRRTFEIDNIEVESKPKDIATELKNKNKENQDKAVDFNPYKHKKKFLVDQMFPCASKNEKKLLSDVLEKAFAIIRNSTDKKTSEYIITKIKEELK